MSAEKPLYTFSFFQVLAGAMLTMTAVSMQFHFGEYVASVGYSVDVLGWITGIGVAGTILLRPHAGTWIDSVGCRPCFVAAAVGGAIANFSFQFATSFWSICAIRTLMSASHATFLTTVAVYAAHAASPQRRAESLGTVGIGGFMGMMIGPTVGDVIFATAAGADGTFPLFFNIVACVSLLAGLVVINVRVDAPERHADAPPFWALLRRHWPGRILTVCVAFAACLTIQMTFLERFAHHRGFEDIRWFFLAYGPTAIVLRILGRRVPQRFGRRRVCVTGLCIMGIGVLLFIPVRASWHLVFPAMLMGVGHAWIFPSMVDLVADAMPVEHRGLGTSVALGAMDVGFIFGGIAWGQLIAWVGFEATFVAAAVATCAVAVWYAIVARPPRRARGQDQTRLVGYGQSSRSSSASE